ncbi:hypothetical protein [Caballeronia sp. LZ043]|uniref:hypothetical protein n=1 Tax=Caballeronia sp. LZ043 TaxID=3038569 RepID=UPI00285522E7|nr:hypothetical protein [Caballeronia sp. LZ043]MDR5822494.1 hypothetical protein [Caballeronia sp. LZ043]
MDEELSDLIERADERRGMIGGGDVKQKNNGTIEQRERGTMDSSLAPKGKDHAEERPYAPEHDHKGPDLELDPTGTRTKHNNAA